jgi:hypothetical protein
VEKGTLSHIVWCDLELAYLKICCSSPWDTKMVRTCREPASATLAKPTVNVFILDPDDAVFEDPSTYRENMMPRGSYRGHHFGPPGRLKVIDEYTIALSHPEPGMIIWSLVVKYVLTVSALRDGKLHLKGAAVAYGGRACLLLGRGGSGKTEMARALCRDGARPLANTHLLVDGRSVLGVKSNVRVREGGRDRYVPLETDGATGWLPIGAVLWVKYRSDGMAIIKKMPPEVAKANMRYFSESVSNWEIKEDLADHLDSDPFDFGYALHRTDELLDRFCATFDVYYANLDVFSDPGREVLASVLNAES